MQRYKILWVDDEIELLKPYILYLEEKNYIVESFNNPFSLVEYIESNNDYNLILIDENMPGKSGINLISDIKKNSSSVPIIMITKNEEEDLMNEAIGSEISDYLLKPLNPNQLLISVKKVLENSLIIQNKLKSDYVSFFNELSDMIKNNKDHRDWYKTYLKIIDWEISLDRSDDNQILEMLTKQKYEANKEFSKFIIENYSNWGSNNVHKPLLSNDLLKEKIFPNINDEKVFFILIDNLRYDQWKIISSEITEFYKIESESSFMSILPSSTQYSRNSIFSGMTPLEISKKLPHFWINDNEGNSKNLFEKELLENQLKRLNQNIKFSYNKITESIKFKELISNLNNNLNESLTVFVVNIIDIISHAKTEMKMIKELAPDIKAYRSLILSWFKNSPLKELIIRASELGFNLILTSDHGTINVETPVETISDRNSSSNLRYKTGRNLTVNSKKVLKIDNPEDFELPKVSINSSYYFANQNQYFIYKNNYNKYVNYYKNSFQHGGVSMEEMIVPFVFLKPK